MYAPMIIIPFFYVSYFFEKSLFFLFRISLFSFVSCFYYTFHYYICQLFHTLFFVCFIVVIHSFWLFHCASQRIYIRPFSMIIYHCHTKQFVWHSFLYKKITARLFEAWLLSLMYRIISIKTYHLTRINYHLEQENYFFKHPFITRKDRIACRVASVS